MIDFVSTSFSQLRSVTSTYQVSRLARLPSFLNVLLVQYLSCITFSEEAAFAVAPGSEFVGPSVSPRLIYFLQPRLLPVACSFPFDARYHVLHLHFALRSPLAWGRFPVFHPRKLP